MLWRILRGRWGPRPESNFARPERKQASRTSSAVTRWSGWRPSCAGESTTCGRRRRITAPSVRRVSSVLATPAWGGARFSRTATPSTLAAFAASSARVTEEPRVPISPWVRSRIPVRRPARASLASVPPQASSASSRWAKMARTSTPDIDSKIPPQPPSETFHESDHHDERARRRRPLLPGHHPRRPRLRRRPAPDGSWEDGPPRGLDRGADGAGAAQHRRRARGGRELTLPHPPDDHLRLRHGALGEGERDLCAHPRRPQTGPGGGARQRAALWLPDRGAGDRGGEWRGRLDVDSKEVVH